MKLKFKSQAFQTDCAYQTVVDRWVALYEKTLEN